MPRPVRVHVTGALYVVAAQAMQGHQLFRDPEDYQTYLSFLQGYRQQYGFKLFAFALLPDRLHLVIELTNDATISEIMHALHSRYTKHVMKRYGQASHVFQNRFRSTVVEKAPSLLPLTGYVHRLPQAEGLAADARAYPWSSCAAYMTDGRYAGGMDLRPEVHEVLQGLSASERYETVVDGLSAGDFGQWQRQLQKPVVGSPAFEQMVREKAAQRTQPVTEAPRSQPVPQPHAANRFAASALTISLAVAVMSLGAAGLYAKNLSALRQTVKALAKERISITQVIAPAAAVEASNHVTTFTMPSRLAGTTWDVQVIAMDGPEAKTISPDELRFMGRQVTSAALAAQGFPTSNYTLALQPDGSVLWESMLTSRSGETVCWRGEWKGEQMRGVMTRQLPEQPAENFTFIGTVKPVQEAAYRVAKET